MYTVYILYIVHTVQTKYYSKCEVVTFRSIVVERPEEINIHMDDALFGMSFGETFNRLKGGISNYFGLSSANISLFWNNARLDEEDTPETVGMAGTDLKLEDLEIHIKPNSIET